MPTKRLGTRGESNASDAELGGWPPSAVRLLVMKLREPQDGRGRPSYTMTRHTYRPSNFSFAMLPVRNVSQVIRPSA